MRSPNVPLPLAFSALLQLSGNSTHTHTRARARAHTHTHTHTHTQAQAQAQAQAHTHTRIRTRTRTCTHTHTHTHLSFRLSLTHTHTHTHTYKEIHRWLLQWRADTSVNDLFSSMLWATCMLKLLQQWIWHSDDPQSCINRILYKSAILKSKCRKKKLWKTEMRYGEAAKNIFAKRWLQRNGHCHCRLKPTWTYTALF